MELELQLQGHDATEPTLFSLQDWIRQERLPGVQVQVKTSSPKPGKLGVEPVTILSVVLTSSVIVEVVKSICAWVKSRRPKVRVKFQTAEYSIEIDFENPPDMQSLLDEILEICQESRK